MKDLKTITDYEKAGFKGIDADLATSLYEYGMMWRDGHQDGDTFFIYGVGINGDNEWDKFDHGWIDPRAILSDYDWVDWSSFLSFVGMGDMSPEEWIEGGRVGNIIFDLVSYYGTEEIFGPSYYDGYIIEDDS